MRQSGNLTQIFSYSFSRGIQLWKQFVSEIICTILQTVEKLNAAKEAWMRIPLLWFTLQKAWKAAPDWTCRFLHTSKIRHTPLNGLSPILCFAPFQWVPHHEKTFFSRGICLLKHAHLIKFDYTNLLAMLQINGTLTNNKLNWPIESKDYNYS